jgi:hypothetical protein
MFKRIRESTSIDPLQRGSGEEYRMALVKTNPFHLERGVRGISLTPNNIHNMAK